MILESLAVALGGAAGALGRFIVSQRLNGKFPAGTFFVNVAGSFLLGWFISGENGQVFHSFYASGFLGAFTTFSTLQFEAFCILKRDRIKGLLYIVLSYTTGILAAFAGYFIGKI
jgi:fluoride exporter